MENQVVTRGIFVNSSGVRYAEAIAQGYKPIETRSRAMLHPCIGHRVAIIRTGRSGGPAIVGYATITGATFETAAWLDEHRNLTLIPEGSKYDAKGRGKWCYHLEDPETCKPIPLPGFVVRHGRSWCEF